MKTQSILLTEKAAVPSARLALLVAILWRTPQIAALATCSTAETVALTDGRTLAFCQYGATPTGSEGGKIKTVIHSNGSGGSRLEWPGDEDMLKGRGIRFISVDRPGHGASDPQPARTLLGWGDDIRQLVDHLEIGDFYVEGWSAGGAYALAIAHEFPGRVIRGALLSGIAPYDRPDPYQGLTPQIKSWMEDAREGNFSSVLAFREPLSDLLGTLSAAEVGAMLAASGGGVDDQEVAQRPDLQELMGANILEGYRQGPVGPARDDLIINQPWGFRLQDIQQPFDVWQGEVDTNVPLNQGQYQASILPNSQLRILNDTAHLFPLTNWEEILVKLTKEVDTVDVSITTDVIATEQPDTSMTTNAPTTASPDAAAISIAAIPLIVLLFSVCIS